jgi:zinc transporter 7
MAQRVRPSAILNFVADAMHNFTDGLAMGITFAQGSGIPTTIAVFVHEVPHNLADFAILIDSGMTKKEALAAQFISALGALAGCIAGLGMPNQPWMAAFVGGGFIYVATVGAISGVLAKDVTVWDAVHEAVAMAVGVGLMYTMLH